jgi:hypothetical protein
LRAFTCGHCGQLLFFENSLCLRCGSSLGLVPSELDLVVLSARQESRRCANAEIAGCNWLVEDPEPEGLCRSCRLTRTRPADVDAEGLEHFRAAEAAKRRLIFQLLELELPIGSDLRFDLLSSEPRPVTTGHADGLITLDLAESDDVRREQRRVQLGEPYRTLLGHFRHEIGHYYWPPLVERAGRLEECRALFGDERTDYQEAVERHYRDGPPPDWDQVHVSAYATMHPWEDWAETFAHYLHIRDTLETASEFGIVVAGPEGSRDPSLIAAPTPDVVERPFDAILRTWLPLTYALNAVNRSMGAADLYPFTLAEAVVDKLSFVHLCVSRGAAHRTPGEGP